MVAPAERNLNISQAFMAGRVTPSQPFYFLMNNYEIMLNAARLHFLEYDPLALTGKPGVTDGGEYISTCFLGQQVQINKSDGSIFLDGRPADFSQGLSLYDWLCDGSPDAAAAGEYCTVGSLPGVLVSGNGLVMSADALAEKIHAFPARFHAACARLDAQPIAMGDIGCCIPIFPGVSVCLKFYFGDEEFPPQLTFLWDKNILQFVRYETVYYIAGCLEKRLRDLI